MQWNCRVLPTGPPGKSLYLIFNLLVLGLGHLVAQMVTCLSINVGDLGWRPGLDPWVGKIPWRRKWQPTPVLLPRKFHGWRSLVAPTVHGVTKSRTRLSDFMTCIYIFKYLTAEFSKGRGTRDQIANICWIIEKARVPEKHLFLLY